MITEAAPDYGRRLVLGGDIGGTSTRILVADATGTVRGRGVAGGGNPVSHPDSAADAFAQALRAALAGTDRTEVRGAVIGVAGGLALREVPVREPFNQAWSDAGLRCSPRYVSDLEVAFAAGTAEPDGTVLIAGTGAVAGTVRDHALVQTSDGHGWLLGDDGSGFWLGREAARAALRSLELTEPPGPLVTSVFREMGVPAATMERDERRAHLIRELYDRPPVWLAELAPLVTAAAADGDLVAVRIVERAATELVETVGRLRGADDQTPIVLAGSLTRADSPLGARLRRLVEARFAGDRLTAYDGAAGAAWLALVATEPAAATGDTRLALIGATSLHSSVQPGAEEEQRRA